MSKKEIAMQNISQCAIDGAAAMAVKYQRFIVPMKKKRPGFIATGCVINRQHLVALDLSAELHH